MPVLDAKRLFDNRVNAIKRYHEDCGVTRAELDLSGGIDSAVMAAILVKALGADNVTLVHSNINTDPKATKRAVDLANALNCPLINIDLTDVFHSLMSTMTGALREAGYDMNTIISRCQKDPTVWGSIRSTIRAPIGRGFNRLTGGGIRHGTGNECEDRFLRFYQKGGDGEVDTNPIEMLSKTEVYQLAWAIANEIMPETKEAMTACIAVTPSPDLWGAGEDKHTDEKELKSWLGASFTYGRINPDTGKIVSIGTIERVARFLDVVDHDWPHDGLFHGLKDWDAWTKSAQDSGCFGSMPDEEITALLKAAKVAEERTRHKANGNIPMLGNRASLVDVEILTNELPDI
jgi:NAD+ synthetase